MHLLEKFSIVPYVAIFMIFLLPAGDKAFCSQPDYYEDFETSLDNWRVGDKGKQPLVLVDDRARSGKRCAYSGAPGNMRVSRYTFPLPLVGRLEIWFYDDMAAEKHQIAGANSNNNELLGIVCKGGDTYEVRVGKTYAKTSVKRTGGWHEFAWECDGVKTTAFIDGTKVYVNDRLDRIAYIALGSFWDASTGWWDDLRAYIKPPSAAYAFVEAEYAFRQTISEDSPLGIMKLNGASGKAIKLPASSGFITEWALFAEEEKPYRVLFKYATDNGTSVQNIMFNGAQSEVEFSDTGGADLWDYCAVGVKAETGLQPLQIKAQEACLILDWIALIPEGSNPESYGEEFDRWLLKRDWLERAVNLTSSRAQEAGIEPPRWNDWCTTTSLPRERVLKNRIEQEYDDIFHSIDAVLESQKPLLESSWAVTPFRGIGEETELSREYLRRLVRYLNYSLPKITDWHYAPDCRYHKRDDHLEHGVRQNAVVAFAYSSMLLGTWDEAGASFHEAPVGVSRKKVEEDLIQLLRYITITHKANFLPTGDGEPWGDHWQSAHWANFAGQAAWHVWDDLPDDIKLMTVRMLMYEANRFNKRPPDSGVLIDTKAEENAWNSQIIALAACMLPGHPNNEIWSEQAIVWMLNSLIREADRDESRIVDGKPVKERVKAVTIHPDFTLENHGRVHPDYMACGYLKLRNAHLYRAAGKPVPASCFYGLQETFDILYHLTAINGSFFYVNGQDWRPHRHDTCLIMWGSTNTVMNDRKGAYLERATLDFLERMHAPFKDGTVADPRTYIYPNPEEEMMARYAELYLHHRMYGDGPPPLSKSEFLKSQSYARVFEIGGFVTHRTPTKFASFAWKNGAMGLVFPSDDTWFTAPSDRGLVGRITCADVFDTRPDVTTHTLVAYDGFSFGARIKRCEGKIEQWAVMVSLPDDPVVYIERLVAVEDIEVREVATAIAALFNEDAPGIIPNHRTLRHAHDSVAITGVSDEPEEIYEWKSRWVNVEGKLGFVTTQGTIAYRDNNQYRSGRLEEEIVGNYHKDMGRVTGGTEISATAIALIPNQAPEQTSSVRLTLERISDTGLLVCFDDVHILANMGSRHKIITLEGKNYELDSLEVKILNGS